MKLVSETVLSELDSMKKSSEGARNAIRWLETEINKGSRYLRMQRSYESQTIALVKTPRKLGKYQLCFHYGTDRLTDSISRRSQRLQFPADRPVLQLHAGQPRGRRRRRHSDATGGQRFVAASVDRIAANQLHGHCERNCGARRNDNRLPCETQEQMNAWLVGLPASQRSWRQWKHIVQSNQPAQQQKATATATPNEAFNSNQQHRQRGTIDEMEAMASSTERRNDDVRATRRQR